MTRPTPEPFHVCFVCTGNICRSPIAALVFTDALRRSPIADRVRVSSAGTGPWHEGEPADPRATEILAEHGYPTEHIARQFDADAASADLLIALDHGHLHALQRRVADPSRIRMLRSFDPDAADLDVPDPYYGDRRDFRHVLDAVEAAVPGLLDWVERRLADRAH